MSLGELSLTAPATLLAIVVLVVLAYLARSPAHRAILSVTRALHNGLRMAARSLGNAEQRLQRRNREVLLAAGREASERIIEREFERIEGTVQRDLARYPDVQRQLSESIERIAEDHKNATEVPPEVPGWSEAVEAVARLPSKTDNASTKVLEAIHRSMDETHERLLADYRKASRKRHALLGRMMPEWRKIQASLSGMQGAVDRLLERSKAIDRHMDDYREITAGTDRAVQMLSSSSMIQFFVSAFVLAIAVGGAMINFSLIARPMAEMVGGTSYIGGFQTADIAALVIILVEISMGLFLMESLRITRLFPIVGALPDATRRKMAWITFTILALLASVEAGLAYMREILMQDELATSALLRGEDPTGVGNEALWITTAAQMGMGFILPFALTFVAIPLESFVHSLRTVFGGLAMFGLRVLEVVLRVTGNVLRQFGHLLVHVYDLIIFAPLWVEERVTRWRGEDGVDEEEEYAYEKASPSGGDADDVEDRPRRGKRVAYGTS